MFATQRAFVLMCLVLCTFTEFGNAKKNSTWPPRLVLRHYGLDSIDKCLQIHNPDVKKLAEFESSDDFDHLPDDRSIKCYMHCLVVEYRLAKPNSTSFDFGEFVELMNSMEPIEQTTYLRMFKKCNKKNKDLCDMVYQMNVCAKKNDNEHFYLYYDTNPENPANQFR